MAKFAKTVFLFLILGLLALPGFLGCQKGKALGPGSLDFTWHKEEPPQGVQTDDSCITCHAHVTPGLVRDFLESAMGKPGVQNPAMAQEVQQVQGSAIDHFTCARCHGNDHTTIVTDRGRVPESTCGSCHDRIYKEHVNGGHSYGPGPAGLGINWERNIGVPHYGQMPGKVMEISCDACHKVAGATDDRYWDSKQHRYKDKSTLTYRNGCVSCHTRHRFSLEEARKPEACATCHMGPDHPNYEAYILSKMGSIYYTRGKDWDWSQHLAEAKWAAPTCAYCHMLVVERDGKKWSTHNMSRKIIWGMGTQAAVGITANLAETPEGKEKRGEMVRVCSQCHSSRFAFEYLRAADQHKMAGDALVLEAKKILERLYNDKIIDIRKRAKSPGVVGEAHKFVAINSPHTGIFWPAGLYYDVTPIEREYFEMFFFNNLKAYKGAFHMSPDYAWWYGYAETLGSLARIRDEASRMRREQP